MQLHTYKTTSSNTQVQSKDLSSVAWVKKEVMGSTAIITLGKYHCAHLTSPKISLLFNIDPWHEEKRLEELEIVFSNTNQLSRRTIGLLGSNGLSRFEGFKTYLAGWDNGYGLPLATRSIAVLEYFLNHISSFTSTPSLFITRNGNLQIGWENRQGKIAEVEFFGDKIEFYIEATEEEGQISFSKHSILGLISLLRVHDYCS